MSTKPITTQPCNTQSCTQTYYTSNGGWGATTSVSFTLTTKPASASVYGNCDDWAIVWVNGVVVYNPGGCSCGNTCAYNKPSANIINHVVIGTNTVRFQCHDACGGGSGGDLTVTIKY